MSAFTRSESAVDSNGCLTERTTVGDRTVVVHYDEVPESDITVIHGIRCTTAIRTAIDLAVDLSPTDLEVMVRDCLDRGLFTVEQMTARSAQPDMAARHGAQLLRILMDQ